MKKILEQFGKILLLAGLFAFVASCGDEADDKKAGTESSANTEAEPQVVKEEQPLVCLWSAVSVRNNPTAKGKYVTTLYLGEEATFLGEKAKDETNPKKTVDYVKVRLADGKEGWMAERFVAINGASYAFIENSKLYKRPDILSGGKDDFDRLQYVVVLEEKDDWAKVKGISSNWFKTGWVKKNKLTNEKLDVTVAILFARAMHKKGTDKKVDALQDIVDNEDLKTSVFIANVKSKIESLNMPSGDELEE